MKIHEEQEGIFEERQALMVSPRGSFSTLRKAHFLKPTVKDSSINGPAFKLPYLPLCSESSWPISVSFNGWYDPLPKWPKWVDTMLKKYQYVWKKSGIFEAILSSCCKILKNKEVVFGVAERWSCDTNTFLFQWAEATISLEDVLVLGGFSILGHPFSMPLENQELVEVEKRLDEVVKMLVRLRKKKGSEDVSHGEWLDYFMDNGDVFEHEAFLVLWLSRHVLPGNVVNALNRENFSIAIYLARGIRIALAPPVLASLYRDLSLLKQGILVTAELNRNKCENNYVALTLSSPIQFVQVWAWERLPALQPKCKVIPFGRPRLYRWHGVNRLKRENVRWVIDAAGDSFKWRPYAIVVDNWLFPEFYKDEAQRVLSNGSLSEELETYARCLRVSELVGTDSVEAYLPHRVAMQFGMDQDIPQWISKSNVTSETAWEYYNRPVCDAKLYMPPRLSEGDVTTNYLSWWEKSVVNLQGDTKGVLRGLRSSTSTPNFPKRRKWGDDLMQIWRCCVLDRQTSGGTSLAVDGNFLTPLSKPKSIPEKKSLHSSKKRSIQEFLDVDVKPILAVETNRFTASSEGNHPDVPPGFPPKCDWGKEILNSCNKKHIENNLQTILAVGTKGFTASIEGNHPDVPPGFPPKFDRGKENFKSSTIQHIQNRADVDIKPSLLVKNNPDGFSASTEGNQSDVPPGFPQKCDQGKEILRSCNVQHTQNRSDFHIKPFLIVRNNRLPSSTGGDNDVAPPGFTPKSGQVKEMSQGSIEKGCELRQINNDKPLLPLKKRCSCSSAEGNEDSRMMEELLEPMGTTKQSEATIRTSQPADEIVHGHETRPGIICDEASSFLQTKLQDLDMETRINLIDKVFARVKAEWSGSIRVKQEPQS
ncbi:putative C globular stage [Heracleum sosnowskyi]|uniref:C globular stage n=1 Tax=Heracleum sosnowskyi TaxID=360622 RepID=A0AAD8GVK0_9APIA|nr:putative C globular stage [Heracleum sosnowskyi]